LIKSVNKIILDYIREHKNEIVDGISFEELFSNIFNIGVVEIVHDRISIMNKIIKAYNTDRFVWENGVKRHDVVFVIKRNKEGAYRPCIMLEEHRRSSELSQLLSQVDSVVSSYEFLYQFINDYKITTKASVLDKFDDIRKK
jgi:hypothetical protein